MPKALLHTFWCERHGLFTLTTPESVVPASAHCLGCCRVVLSMEVEPKPAPGPLDCRCCTTLTYAPPEVLDA